jgi:hypothetical protein
MGTGGLAIANYHPTPAQCFFGYEIEEGQIKKLGERQGNEVLMYIKDWHKLVFPRFIT